MVETLKRETRFHDVKLYEIQTSVSTKSCGPWASPTCFLLSTTVAQWPRRPQCVLPGPSQGTPANSRTHTSRTKPLTPRIGTTGVCLARLPAEVRARCRAGTRPDSETATWAGAHGHAHALPAPAAPGSSDPPRGPRGWALSHLLNQGCGTSAQGCNSAPRTLGQWVPLPRNTAGGRPGLLPQLTPARTSAVTSPRAMSPNTHQDSPPSDSSRPNRGPARRSACPAAWAQARALPH